MSQISLSDRKSGGSAATDLAEITIGDHHHALLQSLPDLSALQNQLADIEAIDYFIAREILNAIRLLPESETEAGQLNHDGLETLFYLFVALSQAQRQGHTCLQLALIGGQHWFSSATDAGVEQEYPGYCFADLHSIKQMLRLLAIGVDHEAMIVFDDDSLYLRRYWHFERDLAAAINQRVGYIGKENVGNEQLAQNQTQQFSRQKHILSRLFTEPLSGETDWQKVAVANALNKSFSIIAGGPGTGKTYTVTKLLAALIMQADKPLDIQLVAPTGKAAQRLSESISAAVEGFRKQQLIEDEILNQIPLTGLTLHRLLGVIPNSPNFRHHQQNMLSSDVVIVDEVSMVDLPLMTRLFRALPIHCKIILLGDCQQLPSVETGSVLADLALFKGTQFSPQNVSVLQQMSGESLTAMIPACDYLTYLTKSRRFQGSGGIGQLANAILQGDSTRAWQLIAGDTEQLLLSQETSLTKYLQQLTATYYVEMFNSQSLADAYQKFQQFRVLSPCRSGEGGVENINELVEKELQRRGFIQFSQSLYQGRPIMITQNQYKLQLFNGDIGILWPDEDGNLKAFFPDGDGFRPVSIPRLPPFETVYAMTIHKTQGSEFNHVAMIIPQKGGARLLTRELLYTGLTRAKASFQLFSRKREFIDGIAKQVSRCSGLGKRVQ